MKIEDVEDGGGGGTVPLRWLRTLGLEPSSELIDVLDGREYRLHEAKPGHSGPFFRVGPFVAWMKGRWLAVAEVC